ncbi:MAG: ribonuclease III [Clostridia bacterium]|nr:ribonuclease III [Clostridia bacterium]
MYGALALAYMGDAVYETIIRRHLLEKANMPVNKLHKLAKDYVSANAQSTLMDIIEPHLTEEELAVYKRGRNAKPHTVPKNTDINVYKRATGLETLIGYLYLTGSTSRIDELVGLILK